VSRGKQVRGRMADALPNAGASNESSKGSVAFGSRTTCAALVATGRHLSNKTHIHTYKHERVV